MFESLRFKDSLKILLPISTTIILQRIRCITKNRKILDINFSDDDDGKTRNPKSVKKYVDIKNLWSTEEKISIGHVIFVEFLNYTANRNEET